MRSEIEVVGKAIRISQLQASKFTYELYAYLDAHIHQAPPLNVETCSQFI